jgi:hypothetical protein
MDGTRVAVHRGIAGLTPRDDDHGHIGVTVRGSSATCFRVLEQVFEKPTVGPTRGLRLLENGPDAAVIVRQGSAANAGKEGRMVWPRIEVTARARSNGVVLLEFKQTRGLPGYHDSFPEETFVGVVRAFADSVSRSALSKPEDGTCHSLGHGGDCARMGGHEGPHVDLVRYVAWSPDSPPESVDAVEFRSRLVLAELFDRLRQLETKVRAPDGNHHSKR